MLKDLKPNGLTAPIRDMTYGHDFPNFYNFFNFHKIKTI